MFFFFFSSRRRHTRLQGDWSSDVCSSDLKVYANDAGDAGRYRLATSFKQGDTCKNGGPAGSLGGEIGRASGRERGEILVVAGLFKKKKKKKTTLQRT